MEVKTKFSIGNLLKHKTCGTMGVVRKIEVCSSCDDKTNLTETTVRYFVRGNGYTDYIWEKDAQELVVKPEVKEETMEQCCFAGFGHKEA